MKSLKLVLWLFLLARSVSASGLGFVFFGDWGTGDEDQASVAQGIKTYCQSHSCEFALSVGDNFYDSGVSSTDDPQWKTKFHDMYDSLHLPFYVALGNHDVLGNTQAQIDYSSRSAQWIMPSRYYTFSRGIADFFVLDTNKFDSEQVRWLKDKLQRSKATWKIVYGHHPIYSYGKSGDTPELVKNLLPLVKEEADLYLSGHDHNQQVLQDQDGFMYVIAGAGARTSKVKAGSMTLFARRELGFSHLKLDETAGHLAMLNGSGETLYKVGVELRRSASFPLKTK
jgi:tartrate-resistant acid phosphatase type 5